MTEARLASGDDSDTQQSWGEIVVTVTVAAMAVTFVSFVAVVMSMA